MIASTCAGSLEIVYPPTVITFCSGLPSRVTRLSIAIACTKTLACSPFTGV